MAQVVQYPAIFHDKPLNDVFILHNIDESFLFGYNLLKKGYFIYFKFNLTWMASQSRTLMQLLSSPFHQ